MQCTNCGFFAAPGNVQCPRCGVQLQQPNIQQGPSGWTNETGQQSGPPGYPQSPGGRPGPEAYGQAGPSAYGQDPRFTQGGQPGYDQGNSYGPGAPYAANQGGGQYTGGYNQFPPQQPKSGPNPLLIAGIVAGVVILAVLAYFIFGDRGTGGDPVPTTPTTSEPGPTTTQPSATTQTTTQTTSSSGARVSVFDIEVGKCYEAPELDNQYEGSPPRYVTEISCDLPHDAEMYAAFDMTEPTFPGQEEVQSQAETFCMGEFASYVGTEYAVSEFGVLRLYPTEGSWSQGDREVACLLNMYGGGKITGSAHGSGR